MSLYRAYQNVTFLSLPKCNFLELTKMSLLRAYQIVTTTFIFTKLLIPILSLSNSFYQISYTNFVITRFVAYFYHIRHYQIFPYQIVTTTFVFTKLCLSFLCLPDCCYQNDASCTYLLVITKFVITLSPFYQIVSYQICHYQNCHYQISITKNPPIEVLVGWEKI